MSDYTPSKNILLIGSTSSLGKDLKFVFEKSGHKVLSPSSKELDITSLESVVSYFSNIGVTLHRVINLARYSKYSAEDFDSLMVQGVSYICSWCKQMGVVYGHLSSDQVFSGNHLGRYLEQSSTDPITRFGGVSAQAESLISSIFEDSGRFFIFRVSWLFSENPCCDNQTDLIVSLKDYAQGKSSITVPSNVYGNPTNTKIAAMEIEKVLHTFETNQYGIYHIIPFDFCSLYDFSVKLFGDSIEILPYEANSVTDFQPIENTFNNSTLNPTRVPGNNVKYGSLNCLSWKTHLKCFLENSLDAIPDVDLIPCDVPLEEDGLDLNSILADLKNFSGEELISVEESFGYKLSNLEKIADYYNSVK